MKKNLSSQKGYTIAELLAVVIILVIISGIVVGIIASTLRGSSKSKITTEVSQNGQYATSIITSIIQDSRNITQVNGADIDDCTDSTKNNSDTAVPGSGGIKPSITFKRIDGGKTIISCQGNTIASNSASLVNTNNVKVTNCTFSCAQLTQDPYSIPLVNIAFTISNANVGGIDNSATTPFKFSASLRSYSP